MVQRRVTVVEGDTIKTRGSSSSGLNDDDVAKLEQSMLQALERGAGEEELLELAAALEARKGSAEQFEVVAGKWDLRFSSSSKFDLEYPLGRRVDGSAPGLEAVIPAVTGLVAQEESSKADAASSSSPIQRLVTQNFVSTQEIGEDRIDTVVTFGDLGFLRLSAAGSVDASRPARLNFTFDLAYFMLAGLRIPYPVPFQLLGDEAKGWIETTYASPKLRVSRGNKGTVFILTRSATASASTPESAPSPEKKAERLEVSSEPKSTVVILPGLANSADDYADMSECLAKRGFTVSTVPIERQDWLRNAAGVADIRWWQGVLEPRPVLDWYFERAAQTIREAAAKADGGQVVLCGHSAGGWLARVLLGSYFTAEESQALVRKLVTLGTPHLPPLEGSEGTFDQTRGILSYVQNNYGDLPDGIAGVSVGGRCILGSAEVSEVNEFATGIGYQQVHGKATVWGDGIVPIPSMRMPEWEWRELEGVWHSPLGALGRKWYGDKDVVATWCDMLE